MKLIIKDKCLEEDLSYYIFALVTGLRGNYNPLLGLQPTPFFEATFIFAHNNNEEAQKIQKLLHNILILNHLIDEIIIEKEYEQDVLYENVYIHSYNYGVKRNPDIWEYKVCFEALKVSLVLSPEEQRACDALTLIHTGELWIGVGK